jgi:hypothetical protein
MNATRRVVAPAVAVLALCCGSCAFSGRRDAPKDWRTVPTPTRECPDLTGDYAGDDQSRAAVPLAKWILPKTANPLERVKRVSFAGPANGSLTVRLIEAPGEEVVIREFEEGKTYRCDSGWLVLPGQRALMPLIFYGANDARLARTVDGKLAVEATELYIGPAPYILIPIVESSSTWHLYLPAGD